MLAVAEDVIDCHADDPTDRLGEQQDQTGGDPLVLAHWVGVDGRAVRDDQPRHPTAVHAPPQEGCGSSSGMVELGFR
ncbi:hypothetical protein [Streptomyces sp. CRN 30]|uniref:hypothetical protein n=1 Tax=Streptomyces sp. CRN 30 TaxID=3075613 RepID=UPI002A818AC9|nr:hypothetical protein [Streptomyces sp. CRN 30]